MTGPYRAAEERAPERSATAPYDESFCGEGVLRQHRRPPKHRCRPPGWWARLLAGVRDGDLWRCLHCQAWWRFHALGAWARTFDEPDDGKPLEGSA